MDDKIGDRILGGRYEVYRQVRGALGDGRVELGRRGRCRFCRRGPGATFRQVAHTIPEALGNKWIISLDECDDCNALFSRYEGALANAVAPLLTLGGVQGKSGEVRQTGRSAGNSVLTRTAGPERPHIALRANGFEASQLVGFNTINGQLLLKMPIAGVPFRPRHAYKALCKVALAIMPETDLAAYERLRLWLQDLSDTLDFPVLDVALSAGSVGNAPALAVATLLRRLDPDDPIPHFLFILCAGSVCLQIDLMSDQLEDHLPPTPIGAVNIRWANILAGGEGQQPIRLDYGAPVHLNWTAQSTEPQPIEFVRLDFDPQTTAAELTPLLRGSGGS